MNLPNSNNQIVLQTKWLDGSAVMQLMKVNKNTLEAWCKLKVVVYCTKQGQVYYDAADIEWLRQRVTPVYK